MTTTNAELQQCTLSYTTRNPWPFVLSLLLIGVLASTPLTAIASTGPVLDDILDLINEARSSQQQCGDTTYDPAPPLAWSSDLETAATGHSEDMVARNYFSHENPDGRSARDRIRSVNSAFNHVAENIARGQSSPEQVMESWMNSPGHCANIMNDRFTKVGVGLAMGTMERNGNSWEMPYWTLKLAREADQAERIQPGEPNAIPADRAARPAYEAKQIALDHDAILNRLTELRQGGYSCTAEGRPQTAFHVLAWHDELERWAMNNSSRAAEQDQLNADRQFRPVRVDSQDGAFDWGRMIMEQGPANFEEALQKWLSDPAKCRFIFNAYNTHTAVSASVQSDPQTGEPKAGADVYWTLMKGRGTPQTMQDEFTAFFSGQSIELYGRPTCSLTQRMHRELTAFGIDHEAAFYEGWEGPNFDKKRAARRQASQTVRGAPGLPILVIGDTVYSGFSTLFSLYQAMQPAD